MRYGAVLVLRRTLAAGWVLGQRLNPKRLGWRDIAARRNGRDQNLPGAIAAGRERDSHH